MNTRSTTTRPRHLAAIAVAIAVWILGGCGDDDDAATSDPAVTDAPTTVAPTTTESPTTTDAPDPTDAPAATDAPETTPAPTSDPVEVAFETSNQQAAPLYNDAQVPSFAVSSDMSGDLVGSISSAVLNVPGSMIAESWFEGSVADCGTGGMALRIGTRPDGATGWEVVAGLGTGDLVDVTGSGTEVAPKFTGTITCHGEPGFATTLLTPAPTDPAAVECQPPASAVAITQQMNVPMHPAMAAPARMSIMQSQSADATETYWGVLLWPPVGETTDLVNAMASIRIGPGCGAEGMGMARVLVDDLYEADFHGAWDVLPAANNGVVGGGEFPGTGAILVP